jgi:hypothetical protein
MTMSWYWLSSHRTKTFGRDIEKPLCICPSVRPTTFWSISFEWKQICGPYFQGSCVKCVTNNPCFGMILMTFPQRKIQFLLLSAGQIGVWLIPILCLFSNQLFT